MQIVSPWISLERLSNVLSENVNICTVYSNCFQDIAIQRQVGIVTHPVGHGEQKG